MSLVDSILIVDGKDYSSDNYRLSAGRFVTDLIAVSNYALTSTDPEGELPYYVGIPTSNDFVLSWDVFPSDAYIILKAPEFACSAVTLNFPYSGGLINTDLYSIILSSITASEVFPVVDDSGIQVSSIDPNGDFAVVISNYFPASTFGIVWDMEIVGGAASTGDNNTPGVNSCLIVPTTADLVTAPDGTEFFNTSSKFFRVFTLSGGIESVRVTVSTPPTAIVTAKLSAIDGSESEYSYIIDYYDVSANSLYEHNIVDAWYIDVTGFMFPDQYLYSDWWLGWTVDGSLTTEQISSYYYGKNDGQLLPYDGFPYKVNPPSENHSIDRMRFYFTEPGVKTINFYVISSNVEPPTEFNTLAGYTLSTRYFNNTAALDVEFVDGQFATLPNTLTLSAFSFFNNNTTPTHLDSSYPQIRWSWEGDPAISAEIVKDSSAYLEGTPINADLGDTIEFQTNDKGIYNISVFTQDVTATYTWFNFTPTSVFLEYEYDNCSPNRVVMLSALTWFNGEKVLFFGTDDEGNPVKVKWSWDTNNVNAISPNGFVLNNGIYFAFDANPLSAFFNNPPTLIRTLSSTTFTVSSDDVAPPNNEDDVTINYDLKPLGFEIDFDINYETASLIDDQYYRIVDGGNLNLNYMARIKPDNNTGWLPLSDIQALPDANDKIYFYINGDRNNKLIDSVGIASQTINVDSPNLINLSSVTFEVSCLSASPVFGYGHTLSRTVDLRVYNDSVIPDLSAVLFPEFHWRLPNTNPSVCSLFLDPDAYWTYLAYPSAYGEGRTNLFIGSAFDVGFSYSNFIWGVEGINDLIIDDVLNINLPSQANQSTSTNVIVGGFLTDPSISLLNTTLSTYKNDSDGTIETFKNWKEIPTPILQTLYDDPTAIEIVYDVNVIDGNNVFYNFNVDLQYPDYSPVSLNRNTTTIVWNIVSDTGINFSGEVLNGQDYSIFFNSEQTEVNTLFVNAVIYATKNIPNRGGYTFNYPIKTNVYHVPAPLPAVTAIDTALVNFSISANDPYSILGNNTASITAFSPVDIEGVIFTTIDNPDFQWTVGNSALNVNQPFLSSLPFVSQFPSSTAFTGSVTPITLSVTDGDQTYTRTKNLIINPRIDLNWRLIPDNSIVQLGQETFFYNQTESIIPLSGFIYRFEDESEYYQLLYGDLFYKDFDSVGVKNLLVTAVDLKGYIYETRLSNVITVISSWQEYIEDQFLGEDVLLPFSFDNIKIKPNEWVISDNINISFNKIYSNLLYLDNISKFYAIPPYELLGWFGDVDGQVKWNLSPFDDNFNNVTTTSNINDLVSYQVINKDYVLLAYKNKLEIRENLYNSNVIEEKFERSINDGFVEIKNAVTDSEGKIIILDRFNFGTITIYEYNPLLKNSFKYIAEWGGLGSVDSRTKFNRANDLTIDHKDIIFVSDTGNRAIKKYTKTGGWIETVTSDKFNPDNLESEGTVENGSIISASNGRNDLTYALTNRLVVMFEGQEEVGAFSWRPDNDKYTPVKIVASSDDNIVYIVCEEIILKYTKDGYFIGFFGETPEEYTTNIADVKYTNLFHYDSRVLHLISSNFILKYSELINLISIKPEIVDIWWQLNSIRLHSEEFVDYWVYNKSFSRIWENLNYFRESLQGRVLFFTDRSGKLIYKLYRRDEFYRPPFSYTKDDVLIGVNELVTTNVINRSLDYLHTCTLELLEMITNQNVRYRWVDTIEIGSNPRKYIETKKNAIQPIRWGDAIS